MPEKDSNSVPFASDDRAESQLWAALGEIPRATPSSELRRRFYSSLHEAGRPGWAERLGAWLGMSANRGWITAAACLVLGFGFAQVIDRPGSETTRLAALENNVTELQRELILDRLEDVSANTRLRGVVDASRVGGDDPQLVSALLDRAAQDTSLSVRSAAIEALGSQLDQTTGMQSGSGEIGSGLMRLLEEAESPIVQLALIDLFLRHGDGAQLRQLGELAESGQLHPDLVRHVNTALGGQSI